MRALLATVLTLAFAAPALAEIAVGDPAPDFTLKDQDGKDVKLSSFKGQKNVVVAFYPKDFSAGCTNQMKCLVREIRKFTLRDTALLAISADGVESHARFATTLGVPFRLLADTDLAVAKLYDVFTPSAAGAFAARSAFVVDKEGKVRWLDRNLKVPVGNIESTELYAAVAKLGGRTDPIAAIAELPAPERDGKTAFIQFARALLDEDMIALEALIDPEACARPGEAMQMQRDRRKALVDRYRALADKQDLKSLKLGDVIDLSASRVLAKDAATPAGLTAFGAEAREMAARLADGEMLVIGRTTAPKLGDVQVLARDVVMRIRRRGTAWTIVEIIS